MSFFLEEFFSLYKLTSGRRLFSLREIIRLASNQERLKNIVAKVQRAIASAVKWRELESRWALQQDAPAPPSPSPLQAIDFQVDDCLGGFEGSLENTIRMLGPDSTEGKAASAMLKIMFPLGLAAVVQQPFPEEVETVAEIVVKLAKKPGSDHIKTLGLQKSFNRLKTLSATYRKVLGSVPRPLLYKEVRDAANRSQSHYLAAVATVLAQFDDDENPDHMSAREMLLDPIAVQSEAIAKERRERRRPRDVNPDTGDVIEIDPIPDPQTGPPTEGV